VGSVRSLPWGPGVPDLLPYLLVGHCSSTVLTGPQPGAELTKPKDALIPQGVSHTQRQKYSLLHSLLKLFNEPYDYLKYHEYIKANSMT